MNAIEQIPEVAALRQRRSLIRIPHQIDIPVTDRVMRLVDTPTFQRLSQISQLGVVSFVYPGANHHRFEHSLGVYRTALLFLQHFATDPRFTEHVTTQDAECLILAALLHDVGHWPYCHPIEDINLPNLPTHEQYAHRYLHRKEIASLLDSDWGVTPEQVLAIINKERSSVANTILCSILSGPIDIDKMDYLYRDSLHAGVPYGQNFDAPRLIGSLCLNEAGDRLAITRKGRTAAELMVFARYVMFSEVYWHHAVRSATAMLQRAFYGWHGKFSGAPNFSDRIDRLFLMSESEMIRQMLEDAGSSPTIERELLQSLFGPQRSLYKRAANYGMDQNESIYSQVAQKPYTWLVECSNQMAGRLTVALGQPVEAGDVLIDAPPVGLEVQFNVDVFDGDTRSYRRLGDVSPVVKTLAQRQFDDFVKQVRIFVKPKLKAVLKQSNVDIERLFVEAIKSTD